MRTRHLPVPWPRDPVARFAYAVIAAGAATLALEAWTGAFAPLAHPTAMLVVLIALSGVSEALLIRVPGQHDEVRVSMSSLTAIVALTLYGTGAGIVCFAVMLGFYDLGVRRARPLKGWFNVAQCTLAMAAAGAVAAAGGRSPAAWVLAAAALLVVNNFCTARVTSLAMAVPFWQQLRATLGGVFSDAMLLAYAPIVCVVIRSNGWLLPLVGVPFAALLWSGRQADRRRQEALHDALTGLPNRVLFARRAHHELERARRDESALHVVLFDLDGFKEVNDTLGHSHGDEVLRRVAERLTAAIGPNDVVARLGGDEFGVVLVGGGDALDAARRLRAAIEEPLALGELRLHVSAAAGIARWPDHGEDAGALLRHADVAMYRAKAERSGCELYDEALDPNRPERLQLLTELREAIPRGELVVHYQPKLSLASGHIEGAEALVRWAHPRRGLLGPGEFVALAEQSDLMPALTASVLDAALRQVAAWRTQGLELCVAVNVPPDALHDQSMPAGVQAALERHGLDGRSLQLEITESSIMRDAARVATTLETLRALDIRISIDDFGTGYSSLAWLERLPVQEIKIDRSFVMEMEKRPSNAAIVQSTIQLGQTLGLGVVAEGVETEAALARLREFGCDVAQGYLISRPLPADDITAWLLAPQRPELRAA